MVSAKNKKVTALHRKEKDLQLTFASAILTCDFKKLDELTHNSGFCTVCGKHYLSKDMVKYCEGSHPQEIKVYRNGQLMRRVSQKEAKVLVESGRAVWSTKNSIAEDY